jgi:flagellin
MANLYNYLTTNATEVAAMTTAGLSVSLSADQKTLTVNQSGASGNNSAKTLSTPQAATLGTVTVNNSSDTLSGSLVLNGTSGAQQTINLGTPGQTDTMANLYTYLTTGAEGTTLSGLGLAFAVNSGNTVLTVSQTASGTQNGSLSATNLAAGNSSNVFTGANVASVSLASDARSGTAAGASLGTLSIGAGGASTDTFSAGALYITGANGGTTTFSTSTAGQNTLSGLATAINNAKLGVNATVNANGTTLTFTTAGADSEASVSLASSFTDSSGAAVTLTPASNTPPNPQYYSMGLSSTSGVNDTTTSVTVGNTSRSSTNEAFLANSNGSGGIATITYSDNVGANLSTTNLSSQTNAEQALTDLNAGIADIAAQDGYIGAQINTLNSVSNVLSTQQENVQSAQNAVQATDYASASSNMSKYEILSQTGIAALAQANSLQQEVTKLLQ